MSYDKLEIEAVFKDGNMNSIEYTGYKKNISLEFKIKHYYLMQKV